MRFPAPLLLAVALSATGCGASSTVDGSSSSDAAEAIDSSFSLDSGVHQDALPNADAAAPGTDAAAPSADAAAPGSDAASSSDGGQPLTPAITPGVGVTFVEGAIRIGETFAEVNLTFGAPASRVPGMGMRSYIWMFSGGVSATVWFANTNFDTDDNPPNDVDPGDEVLWIALSGTFAGVTPAGVGLGSTATMVHAAYGAPPNTIALTNPPGSLDTYYTRGLLAAYDAAMNVTTFTVCKRYVQEPDGAIDVANGRLSFSGNREIRGGLGGTMDSSVMALLGPPDTMGTVSVGAVTLDVWTYSFIGIEVTFLSHATVFVVVHSPYYGALVPRTTGTPMNPEPGLLAARTAFENYLEVGLGFGGPMTSTIQQVVCYKMGNSRAVGATYSADVPPLVTTIVVAHPASSCH